MPTKFDQIQKKITQCRACPRLVKYRERIAQEKRRAFQNETYWGKPVPGFGDPKAKLFILGLAPAAHGANRTGRMFTGDRSGDWLYRALHKAGFANQKESLHSGDGLKLKNAYISSVIKCAPPQNKPNPSEIQTCRTFLEQELDWFRDVKVYLVLGQIALRGLWPFLAKHEEHKTRPKFGHGETVTLSTGQTLLMSYHPSQQNTFTKRLTEPMLDSVFTKARSLVSR